MPKSILSSFEIISIIGVNGGVSVSKVILAFSSKFLALFIGSD